MPQGIPKRWSTHPKEHPYALTERDLRRTIVRLERMLQLLPDGQEAEDVTDMIRKLNDVYKLVDRHKPLDS